MISSVDAFILGVWARSVHHLLPSSVALTSSTSAMPSLMK
jgi:hypothetical protein